MQLFFMSDGPNNPAAPLTEYILGGLGEGNVLSKSFLGESVRRNYHAIINEAREKKALLVLNVMNLELKAEIMEEAKDMEVGVYDLLTPYLKTLLAHLNLPKGEGVKGYLLDEAYYRRIDAIEYAVRCDDGRDLSGLLSADLVIVGVSRTSKTPLSIYLAHQGYRTGNIPLIPEVSPPRELFMLPAEKIVGLTIEPEALKRIRNERLQVMGMPGTADYVKLHRIYEEYDYAMGLMKRLNCFTIDVTNRSIEEIAALIFKNKEE